MLDVLEYIKGLEAAMPRASYSYYVRALDKDEPLPQFGHGIPDGPLTQKEWIWLGRDRDSNRPMALIAAAPFHGLAFLLRMYAISSAPKSIMVGMLRKVLADCYSRGYTRYAVTLDPNRPIEVKLARVVLKAGGVEQQEGLILYHGPIEPGRW